MRLEFLMVCDAEKANVGFLRELLGEVLAESYDEVTEEELENMVSLSLSRPAPNAQDENGQTVNRTLCGFDLELPGETPNLQLVIKDFSTTLTDVSGVEQVLKFYDDYLLNENVEYMRELFGLEMRLRKALSTVYLANYPNDLYNLLRDETENVQGKEKPRAEDMHLRHENEFFHLVFSQYIKLNQRRPLSKTEDLLELIRKAENFDSLREEVEREPVPDESDKDFLASLKQRIDPIEKLRNCVAHNRTAPERIAQNYQTAKVNLLGGINEFLERFEPE